MIVGSLSVMDALVESIKRRHLHQKTSHMTDLEANRLKINEINDTAVTFSLDGVIRDYETVRISVRPRVLSVRVGDEYISHLN